MAEAADPPIRIAVLLDHNPQILEGTLPGIHRFNSERPDVRFIINPLTLLRTDRPPTTVSGLIGHVSGSGDLYDWIMRYRVPAVSIIRGGRDLPTITMDDDAVLRLIVDHLLERRINHFGYFEDGDHPRSSNAQLDAMRRFLAEAGHTVESFFEGPRTRRLLKWRYEDQIADLAEWLLRQPRPFALHAPNYPHGQRAIEACRVAGLRVPADVAITVMGGNAVYCQFCDPPLTNVQHDTERSGYEAARWLVDIIEGRRPMEPGLLKLEPLGLVVRASSDAYAIDDADVLACLDFVRDHLEEPIRVEELADHVMVSRSTLERKFRKHLGVRPGEMIRRQRLNRAVELVRSTELPLAEIAVMTGFSTVSQISRDIKKFTGKPPNLLRRPSGVAQLVGS